MIVNWPVIITYFIQLQCNIAQCIMSLRFYIYHSYSIPVLFQVYMANDKGHPGHCDYFVRHLPDYSILFTFYTCQFYIHEFW